MATDTGLLLPEGFCAALIVDSSGPLRQLAVAPDGRVFVARRGRDGGGIVAVGGSGGHYVKLGEFGPPGANDVALRRGQLYVAYPERIVRWRLEAGALPSGEGEVVVERLPAGGGHVAKSLAFLGDTMIVNFGSRTNSCQEDDRKERSPGVDPCAELEERAGLWAFNADRPGQTLGDGARFATGLRNTMALAVEPGSGELYFAVHGRDQLAQNWGFSDTTSAADPAEEFGVVRLGDDFGWPYCYYSNVRKAKVLAPEYGGDGARTNRCETRARPLIAFPGHWAPMALAFHDGTMFGEHYRGAFLAFHGSWNRAPLPQEGFRVVFIPFSNGKPTREYELFASGSSGPTSLRAAGVATAPDGALWITDDRAGRLWRVWR